MYKFKFGNIFQHVSGLRTKIAAVFLALSIAILVASVAIVNYQGMDQAVRLIENDFKRSSVLIQTTLTQRFNPASREGRFPFNDALARELRRATDTEISFFFGRVLMGSSLPADKRMAYLERPTEIERVDAFTLLGRRTIDGEVFVEAAGPLGPAHGFYLLQHSLDKELASLRRMQKHLLILGLSAAVVALVISVGFSRRIVSPIEALSRGTRYVLEGRYDQRLDLSQAGELSSLADAFNRMLAGLQEREHIRSAMNKVVSPEVAKELLKGEVKLGGEIRFATMLFSDIRDFTGMAESMAPQELITMLNEYLTCMSQIVENNHGVVDKYIGDAIMAIFGAPVTHVEDVDNALQTGLNMLWSLKEFNYRRAWEGHPQIRIGIGVNTGPVVAGNMGSEKQFNYTVVGDSVNLASRLEGLTRIYNVNCVVSEFTQKECKRDHVFRELDLVRVKGRTVPVRIFELWDDLEHTERLTEILQVFQNARQFYILRDWARAENLFKQVLELKPQDGPSLLFLARIQQLRQAPPAESWDGVFTVVSK